MELTFKPKDESGWRAPGHPSGPLPQMIIDALQHTADTQEVGVIDTKGQPEADIKELASALRRGARRLGRHVRIQTDQARHELRFQLAEK
jgi:hypothetical protein